MKRNKKFYSLIATLALIAGSLIATTSIASAAACKPVKPTGKTVGTISVGSLDMPIKSFIYPAHATEFYIGNISNRLAR
jgi:hypothetical protein